MPKGRTTIFLSIFLLLFALAGVLRAETKVSTFEKRFPLTPGQPVTVDFKDTDGDVIFTSSDEAAVVLKVRKEINISDGARAQRLLDETEIEVSQRDNDIRIHVRYPRFRGFFFWMFDSRRVQVRSEVILPKDCRLFAAMSDGSITATKITGDLSLRSSDGTIRVIGAEGRLNVHSSDGNVILRDVKADVDVEASDGDIEVSGVLTGLNIRTSDGNVSIRAEAGSRMASSWDVWASDGDVRVALPSDFAAEVWLHTSDGDLDCGLPLTIQGKTSNNEVRGTLGSGGPLLKIRTSDGDISLRALASPTREE
jgi:hypothetical protein